MVRKDANGGRPAIAPYGWDPLVAGTQSAYDGLITPGKRRQGTPVDDSSIL